jgi:threonine aldolase
MAQLLAAKLTKLKGIHINQPVQSNGVFVSIPEDVAEKVSRSYFFYPWNESKSEYRLMTSWDTTEQDIVDFTDLLEKELC